jgi:hypothetical protein
LIGAGAGLVSAALFASAATATSLAGILFYLAPCRSASPVSVGAGCAASSPPRRDGCRGGVLGWRRWRRLRRRHRLADGGPLLSRAAFAPSPRRRSQARGLEWYPIGRLVGWASVIAGALAAIMVLTLGYDADSYRDSIKTFSRIAR